MGAARKGRKISGKGRVERGGGAKGGPARWGAAARWLELGREAHLAGKLKRAGCGARVRELQKRRAARQA